MRPDDILLLDMLLAARDGVAFIGNCTREEFEHNRMQQLALLKVIEIIGEAASRVSQAFRDAHPELPWREMIGMRHRLVHGYFEIDLDVVWKVAWEELPPLIAKLEALVPLEE
ncbi:HepT-like ribonuclease domain-containing protein [Thermochromatium tepidum]|nr:DUF86 domain-containing protein [Thermochromatium tepidum]